MNMIMVMTIYDNIDSHDDVDDVNDHNMIFFFLMIMFMAVLLSLVG
jgi:hypothetical protein